MTVETKDHQLLGSVKNALRLLQSFTLDTPEKKLTELASSLGLGKSTVSRLLSTLESEGFCQSRTRNQNILALLIGPAVKHHCQLHS